MLIRALSLSAILCSVLAAATAYAHRPEVSLKEIQQWGFKPQKQNEQLMRTSNHNRLPYAPFSLSLPVPLFEEDPIGGIMHQLQDYTDPDYYHAGIDIRTQIHEIVKSPVSGRIEAGYYAYADEPNGKTTKYFLSYEDVLSGKGKPPWGERYFEIAVIDDHGYRFEFHHIDASTLSPELIEKVLTQGRVHQGDEIGKIIRWPEKLASLSYHHLHYNIISPEGVLVNPLFLSEKVDDRTPPAISFVHSVKEKACSRQGLPVLDKIENETSGFIVVEAKDFIKGRYYPNPPARLKATFKDSVFEWDFTRTLTDIKTGLLPDLREYYVQRYCNTKEIPGRASMSFRFFIRVPVPLLYNGPVHLEVSDVYGNTSSKTVDIKTPSI